MNALRLTSSRTLQQSSRRFLVSVDKPHIPDVYKYTVSKAWFSDSSTYPLLFCMGFAGFLAAGMFANEILHDKDLKLSPRIKHQILRDYGHEHTTTKTELWGKNGVYSSNPEGLGVDHEEWVKQKAAKK